MSSKWDSVELVRNLRERPEVLEITGNENEIEERALAQLVGPRKTSSRWWWQNATQKPFSIKYHDDPKFYLDFLKLVNKIEESAFIFVSDDYAPPWPCFKSKLTILTETIQNSAFAEFLLLDEGHRWAMVDTHHNQLLLFGDLNIEI